MRDVGIIRKTEVEIESTLENLAKIHKEEAHKVGRGGGQGEHWGRGARRRQARGSHRGGGSTRGGGPGWGRAKRRQIWWGRPGEARRRHNVYLPPLPVPGQV